MSKDERYRQRFPGWRAGRSFSRCPRTVVGRHCYRHTRRDALCICEQHEALLDHVRRWRTPEGETVLTSEPYHVWPDDLEALQADCAAIGATAEVEDDSPYYPGVTTLVIIRRRREANY